MDKRQRQRTDRRADDVLTMRRGSRVAGDGQIMWCGCYCDYFTDLIGNPRFFLRAYKVMSSSFMSGCSLCPSILHVRVLFIPEYSSNPGALYARVFFKSGYSSCPGILQIRVLIMSGYSSCPVTRQLSANARAGSAFAAAPAVLRCSVPVSDLSSNVIPKSDAR